MCSNRSYYFLLGVKYYEEQFFFVLLVMRSAHLHKRWLFLFHLDEF